MRPEDRLHLQTLTSKNHSSYIELWFFVAIMRLQELDLHRLIRACELYKERTGSESDEYEDLIRKIKHYLEENWTDA